MAMSSDGIIKVVFNMIFTIFYPFLSITEFIYLRVTENLVPLIIYRVLTSIAQHCPALAKTPSGVRTMNIKRPACRQI